jgi:hypothetical protein
LHLKYPTIVNVPLIDVSLGILLGRIRTNISPVTRLVAVPAQPVRWCNVGTTLPRSILWQRNCVSLARTSLSLILLLRWAILNTSSRWAILSFRYYRSLRLRSNSLKIPFAVLGGNIDLIIVFLSEGITDKLFKSYTLAVPMDFINLGGSPLLKLAIFLASVSTNSGAYLARLLKAWRYSFRLLLP